MFKLYDRLARNVIHSAASPHNSNVFIHDQKPPPVTRSLGCIDSQPCVIRGGIAVIHADRGLHYAISYPLLLTRCLYEMNRAECVSFMSSIYIGFASLFIRFLLVLIKCENLLMQSPFLIKLKIFIGSFDGTISQHRFMKAVLPPKQCLVCTDFWC